MAPTVESRNIVVTGSAQGIGRCVARTLLESEARHYVYLLDIAEDELKYCATSHLKAYYDQKRLGYAAIDLSDAGTVRSTIKKTATEFFPKGRIDVLVNNAGLKTSYWPDNKTMEDESTLDEFNKYLAVNLAAPFITSQAVIPYMKEPPKEPNATSGIGPSTPLGGCILNISSFRAHFSNPDCEAYATTKAGLLGLSHAMANSAQRWNIRVNSILPGFVSVDHECRAGDEGKVPSWEKHHDHKDPGNKQHLVNRVGHADDVAGAVEYLMGAGFVTGVELVVDGGVSIQKTRGDV